MNDLTPSEAAKMTGVNIQTIYTWIKRGLGGQKLPATKKQGRIVIQKQDLDHFIKVTTKEL
ncbi:MAG: helix-turn-helix domain-containing protein [Bacteroidota bacterium]